MFTEVRSGRGTGKTARQDGAHRAIPIPCMQVKAHCLAFYFGHVTVSQQHICLFPRAISFPPTGWKTRCWVKLEQNREIICPSPFWDGASCACLGSSQTRERLRKYHVCTKAFLPCNEDAENKRKVVRLLPLALETDFPVSEQRIQLIIYMIRPR